MWPTVACARSTDVQEIVKVARFGAEELNMTRAHRAITAILLTVTSGALALVDTAQASSPSPAAPAVAPLTYTVEAGDYLFGIAARMGVKLSALLDTNRLTVTSWIYPGMQLAVPTGGVVPAPKAPAAAPATPVPAAAPATQSYVVKSGDSLSGIAGRMGVKLSALLSANTLTVNSMIHPGTQLVVPAGGVVPAAVAPVAPAAIQAQPTVAATSALEYVVRSGDYLSGIAPALGVRLADLLSINKLTLTSMIYPGMKLAVPAGGTIPAASVPTTNSAPTVSPAAVAPAAVTAAAGPVSGPTNPDPRIATVIAFAQAQLGEPYKFNSAGPDSWDCSGLTLAAYAEIGISLPHYSGSQIKYGTPVDRTTQPIVAGDLIFLETSVGSGIIGHVGIAISSTQWIHSPRTGDVVRIGSIPTTRVIGIRRLLPAT